MSELLDAALSYIVRGWAVLPIEPGGKRPLCPRGVRDASTDPDVIGRWLDRWPDMNLAVATGSGGGPTVLDVDDLDLAQDVLAGLQDVPTVATARGVHVYFRGDGSSTRRLAYGELRGTGSFVVCPPSRHGSGRMYVWLLEPDGPLPPVPWSLAGAGATAGCGDHQPQGLVPHGQRHMYLVDFAIRLARAGVTDQHRILVHLKAEFAAVCEPDPPPAPRSLEGIACWAARTRIAHRERTLQ